MDPKLLTESGLKGVLSKHKIKDNGLQKALAAYDKLDDDAHDDCLETIAQIGKLAAALKKAKDVTANKAVLEYLEDLLDAADSEEKGVEKDRAAAEKSKAADQKKAEKEKEKEEEEEDEDEDEEEEEMTGEYGDRLLTAFKKLKTMNGKPMKFVVCDARPFCGLAIGKRVGPKQKEELTKLTGGSKRFLKPAICFWDGDQFVFEPEQVAPGLAKRLVRAVKNFTGKKFRIVVGDETAGGDEDESEDETGETETGERAENRGPQVGEGTNVRDTAQQTTDEEEPEEEQEESLPVPPKLAAAPDAWRAAQRLIAASIQELQAAIRKGLAGETPSAATGLEATVSALDGIGEMLGHELAHILEGAAKAKDATTRNAKLKNAKTLLTGYLKFAKGPGAELIAHLDSNPFGAKTNLKRALTDVLTQMAQAVGTPA